MLELHLATAVQSWVDGLKATKVAWNQQSHRFEDTGLPDHKIRADCALRIVEYVVGRAIERSMEVTGSYKELSVLIDELRESPEAQRLLGAGFFDSLLSGQNTTEDSEPEQASEARLTPEDSGQKTG